MLHWFMINPWIWQVLDNGWTHENWKKDPCFQLLAFIFIHCPYFLVISLLDVHPMFLFSKDGNPSHCLNPLGLHFFKFSNPLLYSYHCPFARAFNFQRGWVFQLPYKVHPLCHFLMIIIHSYTCSRKLKYFRFEERKIWVLRWNFEFPILKY
jgi:hypothetical protein